MFLYAIIISLNEALAWCVWAAWRGGCARGRSDMRCSAAEVRPQEDGGQWGAGFLRGVGMGWGGIGFGRGQVWASPGAGREQRKPNTSGAPGARPSHSTRACRCRMEARASTTDYEWPVRARALKSSKIKY